MNCRRFTASGEAFGVTGMTLSSEEKSNEAEKHKNPREIRNNV